MAAAMSPRLPSPPPPAEIQIGPKSPGLGSSAEDQETQQMEQTMLNANAKRRIHPGTKSADMAAGPPLVPLNELDSAFQLQEHLAALHYYHTANNTQPITRETAALLAAPPPSVDKTLWLYELCRFLIAQCNSLIIGFLFDTPPCSFNTCPEMRASEWQFLCAVHEQPKSCCAIDYCCHTLDWAANVVTNPKLFPSRFVALSGGDGAGHDKNTAVKNLVNVFRRLHRIFAHAWFQHRGVFWSVEGQTGLYVFFKTVCDIFDTLPAENYKLPPEAEGLESAAAAAESMERGHKREQTQMHTPIIQQRSEDDNLIPGRTNTRRHIRSSPSTGSAVTTVMEADEDTSVDATGRLKEIRISAPETVEEEPETADVPVIVEHDMLEEAQTPESVEKEDASETQPDAKPEEKQSASEADAEGKENPEPASKEEEPSEASEPETAVESQDGVRDDAPKEAEAEAEAAVEAKPAEDAELPKTETEAEVGDIASVSTHDFALEKEDEEPTVEFEEDVPETSTEEGKGNDEEGKPEPEETKETEESKEPQEPQHEDS
ncbi:MOB kinase activator-like 4 [Cytospora mali]|uniref:MOB kinase activator-like 4 n=1 Tax=Cytospora mali TaxID=578113 RepID=A0A194VXV1_CYTMA|nr:MOB kinase activator-like 4 [Valsa mali]